MPAPTRGIMITMQLSKNWKPKTYVTTVTFSPSHSTRVEHACAIPSISRSSLALHSDTAAEALEVLVTVQYLDL